jgi:hypothetical protein
VQLDIPAEILAPDRHRIESLDVRNARLGQAGIDQDFDTPDKISSGFVPHMARVRHVRIA